MPAENATSLVLGPEIMARPTSARGVWHFAVIADTHAEPEPGAPANVRLRGVVDAIERQRPELVLHLGDVIHPLPRSPHAEPARRVAKDILKRLSCPVYAIPGNHDVGDKPMSTSPAAGATDDSRFRWTTSWGADFFTVDHRDRRFVFINASILNTSSAAGEELRALLQRARHRLDARRLILACHYPIFLDRADEQEHYDNLGEPARSHLLAFCREAAVEAVFSGHIHHFLYRALGGTRFIGAPSTAFLRRDFSEMASVAPLADYGREDPAKLGFLWVSAFDDELVVRMVSLDEVEEFGATGRLHGHPRVDPRLPLGVNLRHNWAKITELPFNPPTDPFCRKRVRDDYTFEALLRTGFRDLRIPAADLSDPDKCHRFEELTELGFRFTVFLMPGNTPPLATVLERYAAGIDTIECIIPDSDDAEALQMLGPLAERHGVALSFGLLFAPESTTAETTPKVRYGFDVSCGKEARAFARKIGRTPGRKGLVFSAPLSTFGPEQAKTVSAFARETGIEPTVLLERTARDTVALDDDRVLPQRVAALLEIARTHEDLRLVLDTFMSFDRGYHARAGIIDRRLNLTPAGKVLQAANAVVGAFR